jgi:hypothetical protein
MKNLKYIKSISVLIVFVAALVSCDSDYTKLVKSELSKSQREDSLLFNIKFGTTREDYYGICFDLNKKRLVTQGVGFSVQYIIKDSLTQVPPRDITMYFYPSFDSTDVVKGMDMEFVYPGWNSSIRELQSDSLRAHVMKILERWYKGNNFMNVKINERDTPVKIDANRRIMVLLEDEQRVLVHIQDLLHPEYRHKGVSINKDMEREQGE